MNLLTYRLSLVTAILFINFIPGISQVSINTSGNPPASSAMLDVSSSDKGFLPPRMTSEERDEILLPDYGLIIMNTTTNCLEFFLGSQWQTIGCGCTTSPAAPVSSAATSITISSFAANWAAASQATSYILDVATDNGFTSYVSGYSGLNVGNLTTYTVTGLSASTSYYYRVRAVNACGTGSNSSTITATTPAPPFVCGTSTFSIAHNSSDLFSALTSTKTYGTVSYANKCWTDRNLGADNVPTAVNDATNASAGWHYQFNRKQGRQNTGGSSNTPSWDGTAINEASNWVQSNDPCYFYFGSAWRVPTAAEWTTLTSLPYSLTSASAAFASPLKLHSAGRINGGTLEQRGASGDFWSSTQSDNTTAQMFYTPNLPSLSAPSKTRGNSIRCVRD